MRLQDLVIPEMTCCAVNAQSKKAVLEFIASRVHQTHPYMELQVIYNALISRERLGSTGIGAGVAIPHCRIKGSTELIAVVLTLTNGIDFNAPDGAEVNLVFALLAPEEATDEHLILLSEIATLLSEPSNKTRFLSARSNEQLFDLIQISGTQSQDSQNRALLQSPKPK